MAITILQGGIPVDTVTGLAAIGNYDATTGAAISGSNPAQVYSGWSYVNITTATTTVVKSGAGTLRGISINKPGTTDILTVYDNTAASGTLIATITVLAADVWREIPANFAIGCTVVSGGTAGNYTVYFR